MGKLQKIGQELKDAVATPTGKQKEAYGRFCHTMAAAAIIGLITVVHLDSVASWYIVSRAFALGICAIVLFIVGAALSKGE